MSDETDGDPVDDLGDDPLEAGMRAAFGPDSTASGRGGEGVLAAIERDFGISSHLRLRDGPDERAEPIGPGIAGPGSGRGGTGRYRIAGEIARGGVGIVLKGRDA